MALFISKVKEHEGLCFSTWINYSLLDNRLDQGQTGFFRTFKNPLKSFHGIISGEYVYTTEGL